MPRLVVLSSASLRDYHKRIEIEGDTEAGRFQCSRLVGDDSCFCLVHTRSFLSTKSSGHFAAKMECSQSLVLDLGWLGLRWCDWHCLYKRLLRVKRYQRR